MEMKVKGCSECIALCSCYDDFSLGGSAWTHTCNILEKMSRIDSKIEFFIDTGKNDHDLITPENCPLKLNQKITIEWEN